MRRSSRVRWRMPVRVSSLDPSHPFSQMCETLVVNMHGAGMRAPGSLPIATPVQLETADNRTTKGWVTDFEPIGQDAKWWLIGVALEQPANFWGCPNPPENWSETPAPLAPPAPESGERKFSMWPGAYGPQPQSGTGATPGPTLVAPKPAAPARPAAAVAAAPAIAPREPVDAAQLLSHLQADLEQRTQEYWKRLREELEPQLTASSRGLQQELQESLASWRSERAAIEGKLQELLTVRDEISARLGSIGELVREQSAPMRADILAETRSQVDRLVGEIREHMRGELRASQSDAQSAAMTLGEQITAKTDALVQQARERSAQEIAGLASSAMDRLERQLHDNLTRAGDKLQQSLLHELEKRQQATLQMVTGHLEQLRTSEAGLRERVGQLKDELTSQSERVLAQLRVQVQELGDKQEQELSERLKKRDAAAEAALQSVGGRILAAARDQLQAEAQRHQASLAGLHPNFRAEMEKLERYAGELEKRLAEVHQAREYIDSLAKTTPASLEQTIATAAAAAIDKMSGAAQQQFTARVQSEIAGLERRVHEAAEKLGASVSAKLAAEVSERERQFQSAVTAGLSELQSQAAAIREQAARMAQEAAQQQAALLEATDRKIRELSGRESELQQTVISLSGLLDAKKEEVLTSVRSGLEEIRGEVAGLRGAAAEMKAGVSEQARQSLESLQSSVQVMMGEREEQLQKLFAENRKEAETVLQQRAAVSAAELQEELRKQFEGHQQAFDQARAAAVQQLESLQKRADELTSLVDVELQKHAEDFVEEAVADAVDRIGEAGKQFQQEQMALVQAEMKELLEGKLKKDAAEQLAKSVSAATDQFRAQAESLRREQVERAQRDLDRVLGDMVRQADGAGDQLRASLQNLERTLAETQTQTEAARRQNEEMRQWLASETERFQKTVHDAFLQAAGELKGRIHQAVEMAEEPLDRRSREIQAQLASAAKEKAEELRKVFEEARDHLQTSAQASQLEAQGALQDQLSEALQAFRDDAGKLAKNSMERWQAAVTGTLSEIAQLLGNKLAAENTRPKED